MNAAPDEPTTPPSPPDADQFGLVRAAPPVVVARSRSWWIGRAVLAAAAVVAVVVVGFGAARFLTSPARHVDDDVYLRPDSVRGVNGSIATDVHVPISFLRSGDCLVNSVAGPLTPEVEVAPCDQAHLGEVYAVTSMPVSSYPGKATAPRLSKQACDDDFEAYVGVPASRSTLHRYDFYPTSRGYRDDPPVRCVVETDTAITTTLRDSRR